MDRSFTNHPQCNGCFTYINLATIYASGGSQGILLGAHYGNRHSNDSCDRLLNNRQRIASLFEGSSGDSDSICRVKFSPDFLCGNSPRDQVTVKSQSLLNFSGRFGQELDAKIANPLLDQRADGFGCTLRNSIEQRIPTANIGLQRVLAADSIS